MNTIFLWILNLDLKTYFIKDIHRNHETILGSDSKFLFDKRIHLTHEGKAIGRRLNKVKVYVAILFE